VDLRHRGISVGADADQQAGFAVVVGLNLCLVVIVTDERPGVPGDVLQELLPDELLSLRDLDTQPGQLDSHGPALIGLVVLGVENFEDLSGEPEQAPECWRLLLRKGVLPDG